MAEKDISFEKENKARLIKMFNTTGDKEDTKYKIQKLRQYINTYGVDDSVKNSKLADDPQAKKIINRASGKAATRGGGGGGGFFIQQKLKGMDDPVKRARTHLMNEGGSVKKNYAYGGRVATSSMEKS